MATAGPGVLRATLGLAKEGSPRLRFPSVLGVPPTPQVSTDTAGGGSTPAQERINNSFMTFNKTQTLPHWHLIKQNVSPEHHGRAGRQAGGGGGQGKFLP